MRPEWKLSPSQMEIGDEGIPKRIIEHVLVEYDGPQLVTLLEGKQRFIGVASDEDAVAVRWVHAAISDLEFKSLIHGVRPVRESLLKDSVWIVDRTHSGRDISAWQVVSDDLPSFALPDFDAFLSPFATRELKKIFTTMIPEAATTENMVVLGGPPVVDNAVAIGVLSVFYRSFQRFCVAMAQVVKDAVEASGKIVEWNPSQLSIVRAQASALPSSYALLVEPTDATLFKSILEEYQKLALASDQDSLLPNLTRIKQRAAASYLEFLKSIETTNLEVLCHWMGGNAVFIDPPEAKRIRRRAAAEALRVARCLGCSVDDLLAGRFLPGACPQCGRMPDFAEDPTTVDDGPHPTGDGLKLVK